MELKQILMKISAKTAVIAFAAVAAVLVIAVLVGRSFDRGDPQPMMTDPETPILASNPYGPNDFQFKGDYLTCLAGESWLGIDVSHHQSYIDWQQVATSGIEYAMIRVGYRGIETAELYMDDRAIENIQGALAAGIKVGVYFFSQAITEEEAVEEAEYVLEIIKNYHITMPVVFDWEWVRDDVRTATVGKELLTRITAAFCARVERAGYIPMFYFNLSQGKDMLHLEELAEYEFWLAMYRERMEYPYKLKMWQYTCEGAVPGIKGNVDIDLYFPDK